MLSTGAYILQPQQELTDYDNNLVENTSFTWKYSENSEEIINAPINDVIFVDANDDENHNLVQQKIIKHANIDPIISKHEKIFKLFTTTYPNRSFCIDTKPSLKLYQGYDYETNINIFAKYIQELGYDFSYKNIFNYPIQNQEKDRFNNAGIYIRPIKKLFEYNPILAKRQYDIRHSHKKKKAAPYGLRLQDLQSLQSELEGMFSYNIDISIRYRDGWNSSRTKIGVCRAIVVLIDFYNLFFQKNSYRDIEGYKEVKKYWENTSKEKRELYPKEFVKWMNAEEKIKLKPTKPKQYHNPKKPKLSIFKISKLKWTNP